MDFRSMCKIGIAWYDRKDHVVVEVMGEQWGMISCSPISGQMAFRKLEENKELALKQFDKYVEQGNVGIEADGYIIDRDRQIAQVDLVGKVRRTCQLLNYPLEDKAFVSADGGWPVVTDGKHSYALRWPNPKNPQQWQLQIVILDTGKRYRVVQDPLWLDEQGNLITPFNLMVGWIGEQFEVFADPLAARNTARKEHNKNETKTLVPGAKINARKEGGT